MALPKKAHIAATMRTRIERALRTGSLAPGDRLPSTREIGNELGVDPRVVMAGYQLLADEGLIVLRPRSGAFVTPVTGLTGERGSPAAEYLVDVLVGGVVRGFPLLNFTDTLRTAAFARRSRAVVIAGTSDQTQGICRELRTDYGLETTGLLFEQLRLGSKFPQSIQRAHLLFTTKGFGAEISRIGAQLRKPVIVANIRPAIISEEWQGLLRTGKVYLVALDPRFLTLVGEYLRSTADSDNVKMLLVGRDALSAIPPNAPTYVTEAARQKLGKMGIPGRPIPPTRLLAEDCVRAIVKFLVDANLSEST